jgi:hypothetical protein
LLSGKQPAGCFFIVQIITKENSMPDFSVKITGDASELTKAAVEAKEQLDQAGKSVEILGDLIGVKVPDSIKDLLASSELLGPALSEAFAPLTAIAFGIELISKLSDKIIEVTNEMAGWDASAQAMYADLVKNNAEMFKFNQNLEIEKLHLNEIGKTGTELITQQIKNTADEAAILGNRVKELNKELEKMNGSHQEVEIIAAGAGPDQMERLVEVKNTASQLLPCDPQPTKCKERPGSRRSQLRIRYQNSNLSPHTISG